MVYKTDPEEVAKTIRVDVLAKFENQSYAIQNSIQIIQEQNKCCGVDSYEDFGDLIKVPDSCCGKYDATKKNTSRVGQCKKEEISDKTGCRAKLVEKINGNSNIIFIVVGCIFGFQILTVILSCVLSKNIREQYNVV